MQIIDVSVLDGKGLVHIVVSNMIDRLRIQDYFREAEKLFNERDGEILDDDSEHHTNAEKELAALREFVYSTLGELTNRIELCGASPDLTRAVTLSSDLRQAVGNEYNAPNKYAEQRVKESVEFNIKK
jgi:hypothetical protein